MNNPETKFQQLLSWFQTETKYATAFSGGVDSCLVVYAARQAVGYENITAVIADSPSLKRKDLQIAIDFCEQYNVQLEIIRTNEIENEHYVTNPVNRCFYCKTTLYETISNEFLKSNPDIQMLNGSNLSDLGDYRPGLMAAENYKVLSPLAECKYKKEDIRTVAHYLQLPTWDKPASPCLSSRFAYGEKITVVKLQQIEQAEEILYQKGFEINRVRYLKDKTSIEVEPNKINLLRDNFISIKRAFEKLGLHHIIIDEEGFKSGKLNSGISNNSVSLGSKV